MIKPIELKILDKIKYYLEGMLPLDWMDVKSANCDINKNESTLAITIESGSRTRKYKISIVEVK